MDKAKKWIKNEWEETEVLLRCIPASVVTLFVVSVICMNLLANKTLFQNEYIALDGGILISWLSFMCMDVITKYFGPKASNKVALLASMINVLTCVVFYVASIIPSNANDYGEINKFLGGTWFVLLGSTIAFVSSAGINNGLNWIIGEVFTNYLDDKGLYVTQTYISTFVGQLFDNFIFSIIVFMGFAPIFWDGFSWTILQCVTCAFTGAVAELIMEIIFSPIGYKIVLSWKRCSIGSEYLKYVKKRRDI